MLILADIILTMDGDPIESGAVRVDGNRIRAVGPRDAFEAEPNEEVLDLSGCVVAPGLINIHTHLDYTEFKGSISSPNNFVEWIKSINALKRHFDTKDYLRAIRTGYRLLIQSGTTTTGNIEAFPEVMPLLEAPPLRVWWFLELIDVRNKHYDEAGFMGALSFFEDKPDWLGGFGLSPHAPYTASVELYRLAKRCCEILDMPLTTHIAESVLEQQMFVNGTGELYEFLESLGRDMSDCEHGSALSHLDEHGLLTKDCIAVHLNYLQEYDYETLSRTGVHVVHCPKCHTYFGHSPFRIEELLEGGSNVCIASDSLASNNSLDLRSELREARYFHPNVSNKSWMEMITVNPASALKQDGKLGVIKPGAVADLAAFSIEGKPSDPYASVIDSQLRARMTMVDGKIIYSFQLDPDKSPKQLVLG